MKWGLLSHFFLFIFIWGTKRYFSRLQGAKLQISPVLSILSLLIPTQSREQALSHCYTSFIINAVGKSRRSKNRRKCLATRYRSRFFRPVGLLPKPSSFAMGPPPIQFLCYPFSRGDSSLKPSLGPGPRIGPLAIPASVRRQVLFPCFSLCLSIIEQLHFEEGFCGEGDSVLCTM